MKLQKIDISISELPLKYCMFTYSSHLKEFMKNLEEGKDIACVIDKNIGKHGLTRLGESNVPVCGYEKLSELDLKECTFIITDDYYREVFEYLCEMPVFKEIEKQGQEPVIYYYLDAEGQREEYYRSKYAYTPLENTIIFRSGPHFGEYVEGMDFADNSKVLFDYLIQNGYNQRYKLVWIVKDVGRYADKYKNIENVEFLKGDFSDNRFSSKEASSTESLSKAFLNDVFLKESSLKESSSNEGLSDLQLIEHYYKTICLAKYFFFTDAYGIGKYCRKDQVRVQLWHGCGFKNRFSSAKNEKRYEYMTVTGPLYAKIHTEVFGLKPQQMLITGIPKGDLVLDRDFLRIKKLLKIPDAEHYILWLPTYRTPKAELNQTKGYEYDNDLNLPIVAKADEIYIMDEFLDSIDTVLIVKPHPYQKESTGYKGFKRIIFLDNKELSGRDIHINSLMGMMDGLISDYSSAAVDFLALNRPIAFTADDMEKYKTERGFIFEKIEDYLPGEVITTTEELYDFIKDTAEGIDRSRIKREELRAIMNPFDDGKNCERLVKALGI